ncbi:hypothetical protein W97_08095 [Coniosporium apollinis CBS 100218]|uniref:Uncharacterized protein n=1 Tax=Coniosporium apollinis (strain CBS 100218) TaxID=1168221 RepID=R7Z3U2_CONA1|nr:uncharacterized protein W97_08095 [Coniosporium apollinis CBS 100218]EON68837.1 hypothetical protein W97_08095 [Coniosporium apollinis CBS 100218]
MQSTAVKKANAYAGQDMPGIPFDSLMRTFVTCSGKGSNNTVQKGTKCSSCGTQNKAMPLTDSDISEDLSIVLPPDDL